MINLALSYSLAMNMSMHSYSIIIGVNIAILHELLMFRSMTIPIMDNIKYFLIAVSILYGFIIFPDHMNGDIDINFIAVRAENNSQFTCVLNVRANGRHHPVCHKIFSHGFVILNMALTYRLTIKMGV